MKRWTRGGSRYSGSNPIGDGVLGGIIWIVLLGGIILGLLPILLPIIIIALIIGAVKE